jgi:hypothetical protein
MDKAGSSVKKSRTSRRAVYWAVGGFSFLCLLFWALVLFQSLRGNAATLEKEREMTLCEDLIRQAIRSSGDACDSVGNGNACYGNVTLNAELQPGVSQPFAQRGDVIDIVSLRRLSAAPLSLEREEWGVAIFRMAANLPRSLPGEAVTMLVFGNTTLGNKTGDLQSFYFFTEFGQIVCDQVPYDGLTLDVPDGSGIRLVINGAELTLMGDAGLKAQKNGEMTIQLYNGVASIVADGEEQTFTAGEQVTVPLGGEDGTEASGPPSEPEPIPGDEYDVICAVNPEYCSGDDITPVTDPGATLTAGVSPAPSLTSAKTSTLAASQAPLLTSTSAASVTSFPTLAPTRVPSLTAIPSRTAPPGPTKTPGPSKTPSKSLTPSRTSTASQTRTPTLTRTVTRTVTPSLTRTATATRTFTMTPSPTRTLTPSPTRTSTLTSTLTMTPSPTHTVTPSLTPSQTTTVTPSITQSPTFTLSPSMTPSTTLTLTPSTTSSPTFTLTPSQTMTVTQTLTPSQTLTSTLTPSQTTNPCNIVLDNLDFSETQKLKMQVTNNLTSSIRLDEAVATWVNPGGQQVLTVEIDTFEAWSGTAASTPSTHPLTGTPGQRQIGSGGAKTVILSFLQTLAAGSYSLQITFDNGCVLSKNGNLP